MTRILKVGDSITYRRWTGEQDTATVLGIEICKPGIKYGRSVREVDIQRHSNIVLDLDNERWSYADQIITIKSK